MNRPVFSVATDQMSADPADPVHRPERHRAWRRPPPSGAWCNCPRADRAEPSHHKNDGAAAVCGLVQPIVEEHAALPAPLLRRTALEDRFLDLKSKLEHYLTGSASHEQTPGASLAFSHDAYSAAGDLIRCPPLRTEPSSCASSRWLCPWFMRVKLPSTHSGGWRAAPREAWLRRSATGQPTQMRHCARTWGAGTIRR